MVVKSLATVLAVENIGELSNWLYPCGLFGSKM